MNYLASARRSATARAVLIAAVLATGGCATPVASGPPRGTPAASPSVTPATVTPSPAGPTPSVAVATPSPAAAAWALVALPDAAAVETIADVAALPGLVVTNGASGQAGEIGIAWVSSDHGATWTSEPQPAAAGSAARLVPWGDRVLAVGTGDGAGNCAHPSAVQLAVRATRGGWTAAAFDQLFCDGGTALAATSRAHAAIVGAGTGDVPYAWSSSDGLRWTDRSAAFADRYPQGLVADGSGFVAFGSDLATQALWVARSADGTSWEKPKPLSGLATTSIVGNPVVIGGVVAVFVADRAGAVGIVQPDAAGAWQSRAVVGLDSSTLTRIVAVDGGLVALGGAAAGPKAWLSADGVTWRPLALPQEAVASGAGANLTGVAVADGRAYLVGQIVAPAGDRGIGALWTGPASLLAP